MVRGKSGFGEGKLGESVGGYASSGVNHIGSWMNHIHMVRYVEYSKIDRQGRVVIPSRIRRLAGIKGETRVRVSVEDGRIVIEPISEELEAEVKRWAEEVINAGIEPSPEEEAEESWKWVGREYAERKLGLLP